MCEGNDVPGGGILSGCSGSPPPRPPLRSADPPHKGEGYLDRFANLDSNFKQPRHYAPAPPRELSF